MSLDSKQVKIKPYTPLPFRDGNKIVKRYVVDFVDRIGNRAIITKLDYTNNKGKLIEDYTLFVRWIK